LSSDGGSGHIVLMLTAVAASVLQRCCYSIQN
jgi:hypothetical protein